MLTAPIEAAGTTMTPESIEIDVHAVKAIRDAGEPFLLLDCREPDEHAIAKIDGAVLIPMQEIPERLSEIEAWRGKRIVVHCHHGGRSLRVTRFLRGHAFDTAQNMTGGIEAWSLEIDPGVPRY
jgi:rhodanese-related sulfurtransferase